MRYVPATNERIARALPLHRNLGDWTAATGNRHRKVKSFVLPIRAGCGSDSSGEIRILSAAAIPNPTHPRIAELAKEIGLLTPATGAITAGSGIIVRADCVNDLRLIVHEFVHVAQYERFGIADFLRTYIGQLNEHGYNEAPFELEAEIKTADILRQK